MSAMNQDIGDGSLRLVASKVTKTGSYTFRCGTSIVNGHVEYTSLLAVRDRGWIRLAF